MERETRIKLWTAAAVCVAFVLVLVIVGQIVSIATLNRKKRALMEEREKLSGSQSTMEEIIAYRETDRYVEQMAREYLNMTKEDEESEE